ncbi:hypothetical protein Slin15195_G113790 [Septoria linicola]|uniref:Uncharacterized protein n=1 Tax=Septoria linicola TaxID=215465 RepID=A0A9Q9B4F9_9PEZI|nr:hypothetical protein Slin15195_G113790 [Septoria linicola]
MLMLACIASVNARKPFAKWSSERQVAKDERLQLHERRRALPPNVYNVQYSQNAIEHKDNFIAPPIITSRPLIDHGTAELRPIVHVTSFSTEVRKGKRESSPTTAF